MKPSKSMLFTGQLSRRQGCVDFQNMLNVPGLEEDQPVIQPGCPWSDLAVRETFAQNKDECHGKTE